MTRWTDVAVGVAGITTTASFTLPFIVRHLSRSARDSTRQIVDDAVRDLKVETRKSIADVATETAHRFDMNDTKTEHAAALVSEINMRLVRIESQFGANGGGLREATNRIGSDVTAIAASLAGVVARFEDHLRLSEADRARLDTLEQRTANVRV